MDQDTFTTVHCSISLDGFIAGPDQSLESPGGTGGFLELHRWHSDREQGGRTVDMAWAASLLRPRGAYLMGRNMYGPVRGPWASWEDEHGEWKGWWGEHPPYEAPVVVLTAHEHDPVELDGTTFYFITGGFDAGLARARELGDGDVHVAGGAATIRQALAAGVVDSLALDIAPVLLGRGERIFDGTAAPRLSIVEVAHSPHATHVRYAVG